MQTAWVVNGQFQERGTQMKWTNEKPSKEGWYWLRIAPHEMPQIVQVDHSDEYIGCMSVWFAGCECDEPLHQQPSSALWAGPIPEPTEE